MIIVEKIKSFLGFKKILKIDSIQEPKDVNIFLAGEKYYFTKTEWYDIARFTYFIFLDGNLEIVILRRGCRYFVNDRYEPYIRAFVWDILKSV